MAKVNFGPLANDARGKINGIVYSKNKSGAYTRTKVTPANPNTPEQSAVRNNFSILTKGWGGALADADRAAWQAYAATYPRIDVFGNSIKITGHNMYISLNQVLLTIAGTIITTPPPNNVVDPVPFDPTSFVAAASGTFQFNQTALSAGANSKMYIFGCTPLPPGRQVQKNNWRFLATAYDGVGPFPVTTDLSTAQINKFGTLIAGQNAFLLVSTVDTTTGLTTVGTILSTTIA